MSKEFTKSYAINRIAELNEQIVEMTDNQNQTMRYLNRIRDENKQLKQELEEKDQQIKKRVMVYEKQFIEQTDEIYSLNQQLAEKEKELLKQKEKSARTEQIYNGIIVDKDKEIEKLKSEIVKECKEHQDFIKEAKQITNQLKSNYQTQLAIQELEKVKDTLKHFCNIHSDEYYGVKAEVKGLELDVCESIDYQIRELKGE